MAFLRDSAHILLPIPVLEYKMSDHIMRYRQQVNNTREKCIVLNEEYFCKDELWKSRQIFHNNYPMSTMAQRIANIFHQQVKCGTKTIRHYILSEQ